jgi:hypothetical protein
MHSACGRPLDTSRQRLAASDFDERKQRGVCRYSEPAGRRACRGGDVGEAVEEPVQKRLGYLSPVEFEEKHYADQATTERT